MWKPTILRISPMSSSPATCGVVIATASLGCPGIIVSITYKDRPTRARAMSHFPATPAFTGFNTPSRIEADIRDLAYEGTIPPELDGAFFRVQPDPQFPPRLGDDISFNGDGMITRFHFHHGRCHFRPPL